MIKKRAAFVFLIVLFTLVPGLYAQTTDSGMASTQFDTSDFPQWGKDLRRAEIVAFGSFPFMYFFANFGMGCWIWHREAGMKFTEEARVYAPWPLDTAAPYEKTTKEKMRVLGIAAGGSVLVALIDYGIVRYKRNRQEKKSRSLPPGTPIIIRSPLYEDTDPVLESELPPFPESELPILTETP